MHVYRAAGATERRCLAKEEIDAYRWVVAVATYSRAPSVAEAYAALHTVIAAHPALSVVVTRVDTAPQLERADQIDLRKHVFEVHDMSMDALLSYVQNEPFSGEDVPRWRVYLVPDGRVAFAMSHTVADGVSTKLFHASFLAALRALRALHALGPCGSADPICPPCQHAMPPPLDDAGLSVSWWYIAQTMLGQLLGQMFAAKTWCGPARRPQTRVSTAVRHIRIPADRVPHILAACRQHGAGLTALVDHITVRALAAALGARGMPTTHLCITTPIDLRRCIPSRQGQMGNIVSAVEETLAASGALDWSAVRATSDKLRKSASTTHNQLVGLLLYAGDLRQWTADKACKPASGSVEVSNMGALVESATPPHSSDWHITALTFSQSGNGVGVPLNISC
ncbi:Alcohol acetyltransferase [Malassezia cuniculi]|uniref:Alcohol acetyltransferase n=1 Tax=Malassezia cuniculi TaxID=948313 RepID=A0AAF0EVY2_9BASI|nr:Alcohol acetyltransferase [Malassezia cuniculi]